MGSSDPGSGELAADDDLLETEPLGEGGQPAGHGVHVVEGDVDDRPDVQHHPVPLEAVRARELGPGLADGVEAADEDVLDSGRRDDAAGRRRAPASGREPRRPR